MPQYARPEADITVDNWTRDDGVASALFGEVDEAAVDDSDYVKSVDAPTNDVWVTRLSDVIDPVSSSGHIVRYRYRKNATGGAQINLTVELRQSYVSEGTPGTLIASWSHSNIDAITTAAQTLSGAQADAITDYGNLFLRFVANQV